MADTRLEELRRRVGLNPTSPAFAALAEECRKACLFDEAIATARAGLERFPAYLSARVTLGRALIEVNELEEARTQLEEVLIMAPDNLAAIQALADMHHRLGESTEDTEVDGPTSALDDDVWGFSSTDASPPPTLDQPLHPETSAVTVGDAASLEVLLGSMSELSGSGENADVPHAEPANTEPADLLDLALVLVQGAETPPMAERHPVLVTGEFASLDDVLGEVAEVGGATGPASVDVTPTEPLELPDLETVPMQGETPPLTPDFAEVKLPPGPGARGEPVLDPAIDALDEDPRVAAGLKRFLDAIVARRTGRRKRSEV